MQIEGFHFECRGCKRLECLLAEIDELKKWIVRMTRKGDLGNVQPDGEVTMISEFRDKESVRKEREVEIEETGGMVTDARETVDTTVKEKEQGSEKKTEGRRKSGRQRKRKRISGDSLTSGKTAVKESEEKSDSDTEGKGVDIMETAGRTVQQKAAKKTDGRRQSVQQRKGKQVSVGELQQKEGKSYAEAVIKGKERKQRVVMGDSIIRKLDKTINQGEDMTVCLPGANIDDVTDRVSRVMGNGRGGSILVHVGTNNADKEGTSAIVGKYRRLIKTLKEARIGQIILSAILPKMGGRGHYYKNCKRMAINMLVHKLCIEEGVGFIDMWTSFVGMEDLFMSDGLHLTGKGAAVLGSGFVRVIEDGTGIVEYLN
ncbi:MAG: hypothetical protein FE835_18150 [Gammaproteobacteria bacterium]|nr:hypothetical protein [Gammaproteobacteria bacterium]